MFLRVPEHYTLEEKEAYRLGSLACIDSIDINIPNPYEENVIYYCKETDSDILRKVGNLHDAWEQGYDDTEDTYIEMGSTSQYE